MPGRHLPPDHAQGDERTLGGYMAVHARPAAFEGTDGLSYSVEVLADTTGDAARPWGAYLLFLRWQRIGERTVEGHLESAFLVHGATEAAARDAAGRLTLWEVKAVLDELVRAERGEPDAADGRPWYEVMRDEDDA